MHPPGIGTNFCVSLYRERFRDCLVELGCLMLEQPKVLSRWNHAYSILLATEPNRLFLLCPPMR
jgi:hypothetical protein